MITIQLFGVFIGLAAIHFTYLYYKRSSFSKKELLFWMFLWLVFIFIVIFPNSVEPLVGSLGLQRPMDLIMILAFIVLFAITFHNYVAIRRDQDKLEKLVRELSLRHLPEKK